MGQDRIKELETQLKDYKDLLKIADDVIERSGSSSSTYIGQSAYADSLRKYKTKKMEMLTK